MRKTWLEACERLTAAQGGFYSGSRKILRDQTIVFPGRELVARPPLVMADAGYTKSKMRLLTKLYLHEESQQAALRLWDKRLSMGKYGSVSFHCYNHLIKGLGLRHPCEKHNEQTGKVNRASTMGPCIQSVVITLLDKKRCAVHVFYRTTELLKKYPADLVFLRDVLLDPFELPGLVDITCYFANVTVHPMYMATIMPLLPDPIGYLEQLAIADPYFHDWSVKWTARYICEEHYRGIAKFSQALRVQKDIKERMGSRADALADYLRSVHPGHRNEYVSPEDEDDE